MSKKTINVIAYSGYRANESPRTFFIDGERIDVIKVLSTWIEEEVSARDRRRYFAVIGSDKKKYLLYYDGDSMEWYCNSRK